MTLNSATPAGQGQVVRHLPRALANLLSHPQHPSIPLANCWADEDCPEGETGTHSHGNWPCLAASPLQGGSGPGGLLGGMLRWCRPGGASASFLSVNPSPVCSPRPCPGRFEGLGFVLCSQGIKTGQCVVFNGTHRTCEIWGWCPVESGAVPL